jgi:hypothetical protein
LFWLEREFSSGPDISFDGTYQDPYHQPDKSKSSVSTGQMVCLIAFNLRCRHKRAPTWDGHLKNCTTTARLKVCGLSAHGIQRARAECAQKRSAMLGGAAMKRQDRLERLILIAPHHHGDPPVYRSDLFR